MIWLFRGNRDPLLYLVPWALAFPPLIAYGGRALGWPGGWLSTRVALVCCIVLWLTFRLVRRDFSYRNIPGLWFVGPYVALVIASVLWSVLGSYNGEADALANELIAWSVPVLVFFLLASSPRRDEDLKRACVVIIGVAVSVGAYSGFQALVLTGNEGLVPQPVIDLTQYGRSDLWFGSFRLYGTLPNLGPNFLGAFLLFPAVLALSCSFGQSGFVRMLWLIASLSLAAVIVGTYSRGAMVALLVAFVMLPFWRRSTRGVWLVLVSVAMSVVLVAQTPVGRYARSLYVAGQLDVSGSARVQLWRTILRRSADYPFGMGFNAWPRQSRSEMDVGIAEAQATIGQARPAENQWMRELADRGIPGVLALALLMAGLIRLTYRMADPHETSGYVRDFIAASGAASVGWVAVFVTGDHLMYDSVAGIFWYPFALVLATSRDICWHSVSQSMGVSSHVSPGIRAT